MCDIEASSLIFVKRVNTITRFWSLLFPMPSEKKHDLLSSDLSASGAKPAGTASLSGFFSRQNALVVLAVLVVLIVFAAYWALIADIVSDRLVAGHSLEEFVAPSINVLLLLLGSFIFLSITRYFIARHLESRGRKRETKAVLTLYSYIVWVLTLFLILAMVFKDLAIFVTSLGLIGVGLTFALQKPILNIVGWLTIVINRHFRVGDCIQVGEHRGFVTAIHSMHTSIQLLRPNTMDKSEMVVTIPNETILTTPVVNLTKRMELYWDALTIQITYESNWRKAETLLYGATLHVMRRFVTIPAEQARKDSKNHSTVIRLLEQARAKLAKGALRESLRDNIETMKTIGHQAQTSENLPLPVVRMELSDSGINLNVLFLADIRRVFTMKSEIARGFLAACEKEDDLEIAYPHMQIVYRPGAPRKGSTQKLRDFVDSTPERPSADKPA